MVATRAIPTPYLAAGAAVVALGILATPARRLLFNVPVMLSIASALLGRKEGKAEARKSTPPRAKAKPAAKRKTNAKSAPATT